MIGVVQPRSKVVRGSNLVSTVWTRACIVPGAECAAIYSRTGVMKLDFSILILAYTSSRSFETAFRNSSTSSVQLGVGLNFFLEGMTTAKP